MTLNDVTYWGSDSFIAVIFALFVVNFIDGGTAAHVGFAFFAYNFTRALASMPVGQFFDKHKGYLDEVYGLAFTSFVTGAVYILLSQATQLWHLYLAMIVLGVISAVNLTSWRVLFYGNIEKNEYAQTVGVYTTLLAISYSLAGALGGIIGETFGFDKVVLIGGVIVFLGGLIPITVQQYFKNVAGKKE